ncbi:MAG: GIY-YIG nuclease family protein [Clostridia bacterium]|nr:GIY-YIG nuclease family protein [Clostridia bacterium]
MKKSNYVYMVRCADNTIYSGYAVDPEKRVEVHNSGKGAKYTRARLPVKLVYYEEFETKREALQREIQ